MIVAPLKTKIVQANEQTILSLLDEFLPHIKDGYVLAITSKVVALCEGRVVPINSAEKKALLAQEADLYIDPSESKSMLSMSIKNGTMIPEAGIDESNAGENYVLWPKDPQESATEIWRYLKQKFQLNNFGVIITDSSIRPLHYGTEGTTIAYCGFAPTNIQIDEPDVFGRPFRNSPNIADGLAGAAVVVMGEGSEQTPMAIIEDVPFVKFENEPPTAEQLSKFYIPIEKDRLYGPIISSANWQKGKK